jgi:hypothetical protein
MAMAKANLKKKWQRHRNGKGKGKFEEASHKNGLIIFYKLSIASIVFI